MIHTSVIIPTLHSPWLPQLAEALRGQRYDLAGTEVLIIGLDRGAAAQEDELIRHISQTEATPPAQARNIGIRAAKGELLCFLDSDCIPSPTWLAELTASYENPDVSIVGGAITFPNDLPTDYWTICDTVAHFGPVIQGAHGRSTRSGVELFTLNHLPTLNFSARRSVFESVGLFDEAFLRPSGEDTELTKRMVDAGFTLHLAETAVIYHAAKRCSLVDVLRRSYHHGQAARVASYRQQLLGESSLFQRWPLLLTAPLRALAVTVRLYQRLPGLRRYWSAFPVVYLIKLVWSISVFQALARDSEPISVPN